MDVTKSTLFYGYFSVARASASLLSRTGDSRVVIGGERRRRDG
jgi:hypothetical protein